MMRRPLIILVSVAGFGGLFALYLALQPPSIRMGPGGQEVLTPREMTPNDTGRALGPGEGLWVSQYDARMRLVSQFRASDMLPKPDGAVEAVYPEARIPLSGGDVIHLQADRGTVLVKDLPASANNPLGSSMPGMPTRGTMQNVLVRISNAAGQPVLAARVNNVAFDLDTFRIYTDQYTDASGAVVPADRVKVEVRGEEMDFDGYGLTLRWDDRHGIIQLLEIAHGERVVIKKAIEGIGPTKAASASTVAPPVVDRSLQMAIHRPVELASADATATAAAVPQATETKTERRQTLYRATLVDGVTITQGEQPLGTGDRLTIDFLTESTVRKEEPATEPAGVAAAASPAPAVEPGPTPPAPAAPATTTAVAAEPIIVRWTGPLRMVPHSDAPLAPMKPGEAVAELSGQAVTLRQAGATVHAGAAQYHTGTGGATLRPVNGDSAITIRDADGRTITTNALDYDGQGRVAVLGGAGQIQVPATKQTDGQSLQANWTQRATVKLAGDERATTLSQIDCEGDVAIAHPRLAMTSQHLGLSFEPSAKPDQPALRHIVATGRVKALTTGDAGQQTIESDKLQLFTRTDAKGQPTPERFQANGNVHAYDATQHLYADALTANLATNAARAGEIELTDLRASGNVRARSNDGTVATGDQLDVTMVDGEAEVELTSQTRVTVTGPQGTVVGPAISVSGKEGIARVLGAGSIEAVQGQGQQARPVTVNWAKEATLDARGNVVDIVGDVQVRSTSPTGSVETATSEHVRVTLADRAAAATQSVRPARPTSPATTRSASVAGGLGAGADAFGDKEPVRITLLGNVEVRSVEQVNDVLARQFVLQSDEVQYHLKDDRLLVPLPGRVLYEDVRPAGVGGDVEGRGAVAMGWKEAVTIDRRRDRATVEGDVVIKHQPLSPEGVPLEVFASRIDADLTPDGQPAPRGDALPGVRRVVASGPVTFASAGRTFEGHQLTYDAATQVVVASGTGREPLRVLDATGALTGTADAVHFNLGTGLVEQMPGFMATVRR